MNFLFVVTAQFYFNFFTEEWKRKLKHNTFVQKKKFTVDDEAKEFYIIISTFIF